MFWTRMRKTVGVGTRRLVYIFANAFATYRAHTRTLVLAGLIIFVPAAALEAGVEAFADAQIDPLPLDGILVLLTAIGTNTIAYQMYKGVATRASVLWHSGDRDISVRDVLTSLPYLQLVIVDVVLTLGTVVGVLAFVIPGLIFGTFFSLAPVVVELDDCSAWQGLKRSARLVRHNFWLVGVLQVLVLAVVALAEELFKLIGNAIIPGSSPVGDAIALGAIVAFLASMLIKPISALAVIELTLELRGDAPSGLPEPAGPAT